MADVRELDQIQIEIERLHERSQNNKAEIQSHEAVCEERYNSIVTMFERLENRLDKIDSEVDSIKEVATTGRALSKNPAVGRRIDSRFYFPHCNDNTFVS